MPPLADPLKYRFTALYRDGSIFEQQPNDQSRRTPNRSSFADVHLPALRGFLLQGAGHTYAVDLTDGHFEIDNISFRMHDETNLSNFRLIFFRRHRHSFNPQHQELSHQIVFRLGWQALTFENLNIQRVMEID